MVERKGLVYENEIEAAFVRRQELFKPEACIIGTFLSPANASLVEMRTLDHWVRQNDEA